MTADYVSLANFRFQIRQFLKMSEDAALGFGLEPQQHQLLLATKALAEQGEDTSICVLTEKLLLKHHSTIGLVDRLEAKGLIVRRDHPLDKRRVVIELTPEGEQVIEDLTVLHREEFEVLGPNLIASLRSIERAAGIPEAVTSGELSVH